uniref:C2H2-type domain-containing protein n=1 Tax=Heterorhabditis bacteriophora TaxID=37862 RepID=A0A1I7WF40_HETBA
MCTQVIDLYPSEEEIIVKDDDLKCNHCEKRFSNSSAKRMHLVKTHRIIECEEDRRLYDRSVSRIVRTFIYHCPVEGCLRRDVKFEGMRNLKQHYIRVHTIKTLLCKCGGKFALEKDLFYHQKTRCVVKIQDISKEIPRKPKMQSKKKHIRKADHLIEEARKKEFQLLDRTGKCL